MQLNAGFGGCNIRHWSRRLTPPVSVRRLPMQGNANIWNGRELLAQPLLVNDVRRQERAFQPRRIDQIVKGDPVAAPVLLQRHLGQDRLARREPQRRSFRARLAPAAVDLQRPLPRQTLPLHLRPRWHRRRHRRCYRARHRILAGPVVGRHRRSTRVQSRQFRKKDASPRRRRPDHVPAHVSASRAWLPSADEPISGSYPVVRFGSREDPPSRATPVSRTYDQQGRAGRRAVQPSASNLRHAGRRQVMQGDYRKGAAGKRGHGRGGARREPDGRARRPSPSTPPPPTIAPRKILVKPAAEPALTLRPATPVLLRPARRTVPVPKQVVSILDAQLRPQRNVEEMLVDAPAVPFSVCGAIGSVASGKSTLLSALSRFLLPSLDAATAFNAHSEASLANGSTVTSGVDAIFCEQHVVVDCQALNPLVLGGNAHSLQMQSTEVAMFALSVCNILLVVQDAFCEDSILHTLASAAMLKRAGAPGDSSSFPSMQHCARCVFVYNKVPLDRFTPSVRDSLHDRLRAFLDPAAFPSTSQPVLNDLLTGDERRDPGLDLFLVPCSETATRAHRLTMDELWGKVGQLCQDATASANPSGSFGTWFADGSRVADDIRNSRLVSVFSKAVHSQRLFE